MVSQTDGSQLAMAVRLAYSLALSLYVSLAGRPVVRHNSLWAGSGRGANMKEGHVTHYPAFCKAGKGFSKDQHNTTIMQTYIFEWYKLVLIEIHLMNKLVLITQ